MRSAVVAVPSKHLPDGASVRMAAVQAPMIPVVAEWIRACPGAISLGQGVVRYPPPPQAIERAVRYLQRHGADDHKYKLVSGIDELQSRLSDKLRAENGIRLAEDTRLVVTAGGNMAFFNALLAIADPGDEIILPSPYYFNHQMAVDMLNCRPVAVPTGADYQLDIAAIARAITPRTRAVVTISPNNPTGAVYPRAALEAVNQLCRDAGIYHISDEAYEYFVYDGAEHFSPGSLPGRGGAHHFAVLTVKGLRLRGLADRLHDTARAAAHGGEKSTRHDPDLPTRDFTRSRLRSVGSRSSVLPGTSGRTGGRARKCLARIIQRGHVVRGATIAGRVLYIAHGAQPAKLAGLRRTASP